jgi:putative ABC transport system permease protein
MLKHYLTIAFRSMTKEKSYLLVNITGLSIAVACCFLLIFWVKFELSYEHCYPDADRIYRLVKVEEREDGPSRNARIRPHIAKELKERFPQLEASTYLSIESLPFVEDGDEEKDGVMLNLGTTNEDFLKIFSYIYLEGTPQSIVKNKDCIITKEAAQKLFGKESPVGKTIRFAQTGYTIGAVIELPVNTDVRFDVLKCFNQGNYGGVHYLMMKKNTKLTPELKKQMEGFLSTLNDTPDKLELQAIQVMHLYSPWENSTRLTQIYLFSFIALLILLIAVINYINTSIARAINRVKEVGVRKITGSNRRQLILRFLFDSFILSFFAVLIALGLVVLMFPGFSEIMGIRIGLQFDFGLILIAFGFCIFISILSGGYAAFYLSAFSPVDLFRGGSKTGSKENLRKALIGIQFFLCIGVLICTVFVYKQMNGIINADTGVNRKNIIVLETSLWYQAEDFIQEIKKENPNVIDASLAMCPPFNASWGYAGISWEGSKEDVRKTEFIEISCDTHYAEVFGLQLLAGEFIPPGLSWWQYSTDDSYNIVINESFQKLMNEENPIGITVIYGWGRKGKIIGVVKDFNFKPLKEKITPLIISFNPESCMNVYVKTNGQNPKETLAYILEKYKQMKPDYKNRPVMYHTAEDEYRKMYTAELRIAKLSLTFSILSFVLSLMGVISMISFMAEKRTKEIAIRKINGANIFDIIRLFIREILKAGLIASIPAIVVSYLIMHQWLSAYVYRTPLSVWIFILIPVLVFTIVGVVISLQIYWTARKNPLDALRSE